MSSKQDKALVERLGKVVEKIQSALLDVERPEDAYFVLSFCLSFLRDKCKLENSVLQKTASAIETAYLAKLANLEQQLGEAQKRIRQLEQEVINREQ